MDDLAGKITQMLNDPETMEQIKGLAGMLGQDGGQDAGAEENTNLPVPAAPAGEPGKGGLDANALAGLLSGLSGDGKSGGPDLSALSGLLGGKGGGKGGAPDLSALSGLLGGKGGGTDLSALSGLLGGKGGGTDLSALSGLLGGGTKKGGAADFLSGLSGDTMQTIMRIMPMLSEMNKEDDSTRLLNALRPFLGPERRKKLDESAKMLHMMKLLPLLKGLQL